MKHDDANDAQSAETEKDDLWELLGRAQPAKARPAFAQNVLRAVRMSQPEREPGFLEWLRHGWNWLAFAGAAAVVLVVAVGNQSRQSASSELAAINPAPADTAAVESALEVVSNVDVLLALEDNNAWLDISRP
jgi:hypothetical protein